ncbi:hypothetical protein AYX14_07078, partial [Cryptococcus neoformans]
SHLKLYQVIPSIGRLHPIPQPTRESPFQTPPPDGHTEQSYVILKHLNSKWSTTRSLKDLLKVIKDNVKGQILPCQKQPEDSKHRYHSAGTVDKFRLRCQVCKHTLWEPEARSYFAFLILEGAVPHLAIDLPSLPIPPETSQAHRSGS